MTNPERSLLAVGFRDDFAGLLREAAASLGITTTAVVGRCEDAVEVLADLHPVAVVLHHDAAGAAQICAQIRTQQRLALVPIFNVTTEPSDLAFAELFAWGGDDLVGMASVRPIVRRLRSILAQPAPKPPPPDAPAPPVKSALVAGSDATWRTVMGRALYNGGFAVRFASSGDSVADECARGEVRVVVAADDLPPDGGGAVLARSRAAGSTTAWVLVAPPKRMAAAHGAVRGITGASVADGFAPPENVLFLINELLAARGIDKRASPRLLYGTSVAFRPAGREEDDVGYSYNVSAGGLYVRTTSAPDPGQEVWLEMWPPRAERRVRLAGKVAWRRPFGPIGMATVPAGFGVQITDGLLGDLDRWKAGHDAFVASLLGPASPASSTPPA